MHLLEELVMPWVTHYQVHVFGGWGTVWYIIDGQDFRNHGSPPSEQSLLPCPLAPLSQGVIKADFRVTASVWVTVYREGPLLPIQCSVGSETLLQHLAYLLLTQPSGALTCLL